MVRCTLTRGAFELDLAAPVAELRATWLLVGAVRFTVWSQCANAGRTEAPMVEGAHVTGAAVFAEQVLGDGVPALVY